MERRDNTIVIFMSDLMELLWGQFGSQWAKLKNGKKNTVGREEIRVPGNY